MSLFQSMSITDIVRVHNVIATHKGEKTVSKFKDKSVAQQRLQNISRGLPRPQIVKLFKQSFISQDIIDKIPKISQPINTPSIPATIPEPTVEEGKTCTSSASPTAQKQPAAKAKGKGLPASVPSTGSKSAKPSTKPTSPSSQHSPSAPQKSSLPSAPDTTDAGTKVPIKLIVLRAVRELIPVGSTGEAATVTSTQVAKHLRTSILTVCKALQQLGSGKMVKVEDDSPDDNNPLFYISLTAHGRDKELPAQAVPKKAMPSEAPGPNSKFNGKKIHKLGEYKADPQLNPRRVGTHGHKSFAIIKDGMPYEKYRELGGRNNDLSWDIEHGYLEVK